MKHFKLDIIGLTSAILLTFLLMFAHHASANPPEGTDIYVKMHDNEKNIWVQTKWVKIPASDWKYTTMKKNALEPDHINIFGKEYNLEFMNLSSSQPEPEPDVSHCVETKPQMVRRLVTEAIQESWKNHGPLDWTAKWQTKHVIRYVSVDGKMQFKIGKATTQFQTMAFYSQADAQLVLNQHGDDLLWVVTL